ncbi:MAG: TIGR03905 family TSCPD domain-containing protein [Clostridia bacterium]|nr:TIGR03905 family TSCPD domain-containing protein [Clostridia bacterium]
MRYEHINKGVCSRMTVVELSPDGIIEDISIVGGCSGNLQGIMSLLKGMNAHDAIKKIKGINCNGRGTSCPDQVAKALEGALSKLA